MNRRYSDITWLAGLLEGEGCFYFRKPNYCLIELSMVDLDVVQKARDIMDISSNIRTTGKEGYKVQYKFYIGGTDAAGWMMTLYPLMGSRRRERIREIILEWKNYKDKRLIHNTIIGAESSRTYAKAIKSVMISRKIAYEEAKAIIDEAMSPDEVEVKNVN